MFMQGIHPVRSAGRPPPVAVRYCAPQWQDGVVDVLLKKFMQMVPRAWLRGKSWDKGWMEKDHKLTFANGSVVTFKTAEQKLSTFGGSDLDAVYVDEHLSYFYYLENLMRTADRAGFIVNTMTPEAGMSWEDDHITNPPEIPGVGKITIEYWFFDTEKNPHLSKEGVAKIKATIKDEATADTKLRGQFRSLAGLVLPMWNKDKHLVADYEIPYDWPRVICIDTHHKKPSACLWGAWTPDQELVIYRAMKLKKTVPEWQKIIRVASAGENISLWLLDEEEGGEGTNINDAVSVCQQFNDGDNPLPFVQVNRSSGSYAAGIYKLWDYLTIKPVYHVRDDHAIHNGSRIQVFRSCDHPLDYVNGKPVGSLPWEMRKFEYKKEQKSDEETFREKVRTVNDDYISCLRYIAMAGVQMSGQKITSALKGKWE
jgi:phage terminase large subunit-like protein